MFVHANLKYYRNKQKLSQSGLSVISSVPQTTISAIESGTVPTVDTADKLAKALHITVNDLLKEPMKEAN